MITLLVCTFCLAQETAPPQDTLREDPKPRIEVKKGPTGEDRSPLEWDRQENVPPFAVVMDDPQSLEMFRLRLQYRLGDLVVGAADEYERLRRLSKWTHDRWRHQGDNTPSKSDPLTILAEAAQGKRFRCVEYAIVVAGCARSLGMPARVLNLKRADVETAKSGAGHVVAEVWLAQFKKWVFVDPQMDVIPEKNVVPLNAVEFQEALARNAAGLVIRSSSGARQDQYIQWVSPYLYYFDFSLDQRRFRPEQDQQPALRGKIMLVPKGAKKPRVFQQKSAIGDCVYFSNPEAFYLPPSGPPPSAPTTSPDASRVGQVGQDLGLP